jgi:ketosteroid isomerase-like protein
MTTPAHENLIRQFYSAFQRRDYVTMQSLYHPDAVFSDPVFPDLPGKEVKAMWEMLLTSAKDLKVEFNEVSADQYTGRCNWDAWYTFSKTGRPVHNQIKAQFEFRDNLIYRHTDTFDLWKWSRQALGLSGLLLGWSPIVRGKVRSLARKNLMNFIEHN